MRHLTVLLLLIAAGPFTAWRANAQDYPVRPITIIVPQGPGAADLPFRVIAPAMAKRLGQPVIVENREGAGTLIGTNYVAHEMPADGYTLAGISVNALIILPLAMQNVRFDPLKDLPPLIDVGAARLVLASAAREPYQTFDEMIDYAKSNPGKLNYASSSPTTRLLTELVLRKRGADVTYVPYKTTTACVLALAEDESQLAVQLLSQVLGQGAKLRVLAQTGEHRSVEFPDAPTFAELGFPEVPGSIYSLNARAGTPQPILDWLTDAVLYALAQPEVRAGLDKISLEIEHPESSDKLIESESQAAAGFAAIAHEIGLEPQ